MAFTALTSPSDRKRLRGYSYLWMFPIYGLLYPGFALLLPTIGSWPWPARAALYAAAIMGGELLTGLVLRAALGEAPWEKEYRGKRWCVADLVRLDYFPAWAAGALVFERVFRLLGS